MKLLTLLCLGLSYLAASDQQSAAADQQAVVAAEQYAAVSTAATRPVWLNGSKEAGFNLLLDLGNGFTLQSTTSINDEACRAFYRAALADPETMRQYMNGEHFTGDALETKINAHMGLHARTLQDGLPRFMIFNGDQCIGFVRLANADVNDFVREPLQSALAEKEIDLSNKGVGMPSMILLRNHWNQGIASTVETAFMTQIIPFYAHNQEFPFTGHPLSHIFTTCWASNEHSVRLITSIPGMINLGESEAHGVTKRAFLLELPAPTALNAGTANAAENAFA